MRLREFVDAVTADEPPLTRSADDIIAAGRRAERRRRAGFASTGAAGLAAVAVAGAFVLPSFGAPPPTTPAPPAIGRVAAPPSFGFTFRGYDAGRFHVQDPVTVSGAYQMASVYMDGRFTNDKSISADEAPDSDAKTKARINAFLTVFRPGAFDPSGIKGGQALTVAGRKAVRATLPVDLDPAKRPAGENKLLAWEYADNAWATVTSQSNSRDEPSFADLDVLVPGLEPGTPKPAMLPFTVGYIPAGYQPVQVSSHALPGLGGINLARDGDYGGVTYASAAPATTGLTAPYEQGVGGPLNGTFSIFVQPSRNGNQPAVAGRTECYRYPVCNVWSADGETLVQVTAQGTGARLSTAELTKIVESITVADVAKDTTWKPATEALRP